jgi:hypothetical protein
MRFKSLLALALTVLTLGVVAAPQSASAHFWDRPDNPGGWGHIRTIRHWVYYPRYNHEYLKHDATDRYAYHASPRGYYPYYNSCYWGPAHVRRSRACLPKYYAAWGAPRSNYHHVEWHNRHYGGHRRGDW